MAQNHYKHMSSEDRLRLYRLLFKGLSIGEISSELGFHKATLYRELSRNSTKFGYRPDWACQQYLSRRGQKVSKIERISGLKDAIIEKLKEGLSPEQIAGRMRHEYGKAVIPHEALYQYIYSPAGQRQALYRHLRKKRKYRYPRIRRKRQKADTGKVPIASRPATVDHRIEFGHWEGDLVLFQKTQVNLFTLRERKTRLLVAIKNANRQSKTTARTLIRYMSNKMGPILSLTLDNDPAFAAHKQIGQELGSAIYFCEAYKSYQKGAIENGNRLIREKLPRKTHLEGYAQEKIDKIIEELNNRPMKALGFRTPKEAFIQECLQRSTL